MGNTLYYRSIFVSDVHLGTRDCRADYLLDFLRSTRSDYLYLVGDIFDFWAMRRRVYWTPAQSAIIQEIFKKAEQGTQVIYIPGNHDSLCREFIGSEYNGVKIQGDAVHVGADGRRFYVSHGDELDGMVKHNRLLKYIGDQAYGWLLNLNRKYNLARQRFGHPYWSLSVYIKTRVKNAQRYINEFERAAAYQARHHHGCDGYIGGHIHKAGIEHIDGVVYCNDGDWVEHCTALAEDDNGTLQLLHWADLKQVEQVNPACPEAEDEIPLPIALVIPMQQVSAALRRRA